MGFCELAPFPQRARKGWGTRLDLIRTHKKPPSGAKARADYAGFMRGLKPPPPSGSSFSAGFSAGPIQSLLGDASFDGAGAESWAVGGFAGSVAAGVAAGGGAAVGVAGGMAAG